MLGCGVQNVSRYEPVHPLLADLEPEGWPTDEQQLCGQVCAAYFRFQHGFSGGFRVEAASRTWMHVFIEGSLDPSPPIKGAARSALNSWDYDRMISG